MHFLDDVSSVPLLDRSECQRAHERVMDLMPHWKRIRWPTTREKVPFFMLGSSAYSTRNKPGGYVRGYRKINPLLWSEFPWLYRKLKTKLERMLGLPVTFRKDAALPGFHVFFNHPSFLRVNGWHVDLDYSLMNWRYPIGDRQTLAFTLPITVPSSGSATDFADLHYYDIMNVPKKRWPRALAKAKLKTSARFEAGRLILHDGKGFHRVAAFGDKGELLETRVTLQGFGVLQRDHWELFW